MSTFRMETTVCGLCGHTFERDVLTSTNAFGSPDLDLRPPPMQRATMFSWVTKCPHCGYVHADIEKDGTRHRGFIRSREYKLCEGVRLPRRLAQDFYRHAPSLFA